jgi:hypothetical protein
MRKIVLFFMVAACALNHEIYDALTTDVLVLTQNNWMSQVVKGRQTDKIFLIHFYNEDDGQSYKFSKGFIEKAAEYKGIVNLGFVNCSKQKQLCTKEAPAKLPGLKLYPPNPDPTRDFELELQKSISAAISFLKYQVTEVNEESAAQFLSADVSLPKSLLFTDKPGLPLMYRALSSSFKNKIRFGIVRKDQSDLISTYNIKKFPTILVIKSGLKRPQYFTKEPTFKNLFEFMNVWSEQFVPTDQDTKTESKSWLFEPLPELTSKSVGDICLNLDKTLCVIFFSPEKPSAETVEQIKTLKAEFTSKWENTLAYKFMWIDSKKQSHWVRDLQVDSADKPTVRVLNPGRRKRFVKMEDDYTYENLKRVLEKISGGDARFVNINRDLPKLAEEL